MPGILSKTKYGDYVAKLLVRVRETRIRENITATEFAFRVGISRRYLQRIEDGQSIPSVVIASLIADELGVDIRYLFHVER
jgi:transcriptional regulator with XRE-family HTH domain